MPASRDASPLTRTTITLPTNLLREIDRLTGTRGRSRYVAEAIAQRMRRDEQALALRSTEAALGSMSPDEIAEWTATFRRRRR